MRVLVFGTYDTTMHPRVATIAEGLRANGVDVSECNAPLDLPTADRVAALARPSRIPSVLARIARRWLTLARMARNEPKPDVVLVGYMGHFDVHLARLLFRGTPIVLDHLIGASGQARDRRLDGGFRAGLMQLIDSAALRAADVVIVDTDEHLDALSALHRHQAVVVPVGAPSMCSPNRPHRTVSRCGWCSSASTRRCRRSGDRAALARLAGEPIAVTMVATARTRQRPERQPPPTRAVTWLKLGAIEGVARARGRPRRVLGIFGTGTKALRVVPNKVFQGAAAGCAIVTSDTAPQRRALGAAALLVPPVTLRHSPTHSVPWPPTAPNWPACARPPTVGDHRFRAGPGRRPPAGRHRHEGELLMDLDTVAPLTPNAWLRFDVVERICRPASTTCWRSVAARARWAPDWPGATSTWCRTDESSFAWRGSGSR